MSPSRTFVAGGEGSAAEFPTLHSAAVALYVSSVSYANTWYPASSASLNRASTTPYRGFVHSLITGVPSGVTAVSVLKTWLHAQGPDGHILYARLRNRTTETDIYTFDHTMLVYNAVETEEEDGSMEEPIETASVAEGDVLQLQVKTSSYTDWVSASVVFAFS